MQQQHLSTIKRGDFEQEGDFDQEGDFHHSALDNFNLFYVKSAATLEGAGAALITRGSNWYHEGLYDKTFAHQQRKVNLRWQIQNRTSF